MSALERALKLPTFAAISPHSSANSLDLSAIKATIERRLIDLPLEIVLLTDGDIWRQEEFLAYVNEQVKKANGAIRIFPLGIGNGVSHALVEGLARAGNGFAQSVQAGERMDNNVVRMLRGALSPHITDYSIEVKYQTKDDNEFELIEKVTDGMKILLSDSSSAAGSKRPAPKPQKPISLFDPCLDPENEDVDMVDFDTDLLSISHPKLLQAPHKIPSLFAFLRTTVYLLMSPETVQRIPSAVILRGTSTHGPLALEIPVEVLSSPAKTIHQLAARKACQDLEESRGWVFDAKDQVGVLIKDRYPSRFEDLVRKEAVQLGETFQIANKWCSFVAVADNDCKIIAKSPQKSTPDEDEDGAVDLGMAENDSSEEQLQYYSSHMQISHTKFAGKRKSLGHDAGSHMPKGVSMQQQAAPDMDQPPAGLYSSICGRGGAGAVSPFYTMSSPVFDRDTRERRAAVTEPQVRFAPLLSTPDPFLARGSGRDYDRGPAPTAQVAFNIHHSSQQNKSTSAPSRGRGPSGPAKRTKPSLGANFRISSTPINNLTRSASSSLSLESFDIKWEFKSDADKVLALVDLQDFEGSWPENNVEIPLILGFEFPKCPEGINGKVWVTLLVVAFLEVRMGGEEGIWAMVGEKARAFLSNVTGKELANLEKSAVKFATKN